MPRLLSLVDELCGIRVLPEHGGELDQALASRGSTAVLPLRHGLLADTEARCQLRLAHAHAHTIVGNLMG